MRSLLVAVFIAFPICFAGIRSPDLIELSIRDLSPTVSQQDARILAKLIRKYSDKYNVEWQIVVAIFKQESNFRLDCITHDYQDFGIGQINWRNLKARKIDLARLLSDEDYAVEQTFLILAELKNRYSGHDYEHFQWFTRYNSFTIEVRKIYWYGTRKDGSDGLRSKLTQIDNLVKKNERQRKQTANSDRRARNGNPGSKAENPPGQPSRGRTSKDKTTLQKRISR